MTLINRSRREWFGGVVYSENPGFTAFVDSRRADVLGIPLSEGLKEGLFSAPLDVHMSVTGRCNLRCRGCYARAWDTPGKDMPLQLAHAVIDKLADMKVFTIAIGGGEPFLHPHLFDIAVYSRRRGIVPNVTTNGLLIDSAMARKSRVFGAVHVSCHDPSELPRLVDPVRALKRTGVDIGLNILVSAATYTKLPDIWGWCAKQGIPRILVLKFKVTEANIDHRDVALTAEQELSLIPLVQRLSRRHNIMPMLDCSFFPALAFSRPNRADLEFFDVNGCVGGNAILAVTTDGQFKPCSFCRTSCGEVLFLDSDVWKGSKELSEFRRWRGHHNCADCEYEDLCNGGCRVAETRWCQGEQ